MTRVHGRGAVQRQLKGRVMAVATTALVACTSLLVASKKRDLVSQAGQRIM
jgi:hypothetical protein